MKFYLGMRTWIWNMDRLHKIYKITFPCGNTYVGSTSTPFNKRYNSHRSSYKKNPIKPPINEVSEQYMFNEIKMVEIDRIGCHMNDPKIRILEEEWKTKLKPTLNIRKAHETQEERKIRLHEYDKTPKGRLYEGIGNARQYIKLYTKQNRPDMVKKWEGILKEKLKKTYK